MDGSVQRLRDRGLISPMNPRSRAKKDGQGTPFDMNASEQHSAPEPEADEELKGEGSLPVGEAPHTEAGKRLDVTA